MPTYEYQCTACGERLEVVQRFSDDPLTTCEACGSTLKRVFHPVGVVLKGSGFYATDNRSGKALQSTDKKSDTSGSSASSGSSSTPKAPPSTSGSSKP